MLPEWRNSRMCIINESTATAAIAHGHANEITQLENRRILVIDLSVGTFDVSIMQIKKS